MIKVLTYPDIDRQEWRSLVASSPTATWFQTPEAYDFYESVSDVAPFVCAVAQNNKLVGLIVGYITQSKSALKQFFTRRAIIVGGPLLADDISDEALNALLKAIRRLGDKAIGKENSKAVTSAFTPYTLHPTPIYIESRNFHDYSRWKSTFEQSGFTYCPHYDIHIHCNAEHQISDRRQRELRKAIKNGAVVVEAQSEQDIRDWYHILYQLYREKVRTPLFSEDFFLQFYRNGVGKYLLVKFNNRVIGGMMCPILPGRAIYEWYVCGLDEQYRDLYPSVITTNAAIQYAKENAIPLFDFMGAGEPDVAYGVRDFKMEFGGELKKHGRFHCIRKPFLYKIGKLGVKWLKKK